MKELPKRLSHDAILEAVLEIRFETRQVGEVLVGRLASLDMFEGYGVNRLPIAAMPAEAREADENLRFQPILQLNSPTPGELAKVGPHVLSLNVLAPYPGWDAFSKRLRLMIESLFEVVTDMSIVRLGLRYVNAITSDHGVRRLSDLQFKVDLAGQATDTEMVFSHRFKADSDVSGSISIATPSFVNGPNLPSECAAFVDIDIFTPRPLGKSDGDSIMAWVEKAHEVEKERFFSLFSDEQIEELKEE